MYVLVTVDTEEDDAWGTGFAVGGQTTRNIAYLPQLQEICDRYETPPTYFVNSPVLANQQSREILQQLHRTGKCEIGTHVHPWCDPPHNGMSYDDSTSYLCNHPKNIQKEKISRQTELICEVFGNSPTSFRAGRYGLDHVGIQVLTELGYTVDSSVLSFRNCGHPGPDFRRAPWRPYRVSSKNICNPSPDEHLWEIPSRLAIREGHSTQHIAFTNSPVDLRFNK